MKDFSKGMSEAQFDAALDLLNAPPPSDNLRDRVCAMAPTPQRTVLSARYQAAAALVVAVATAVLLHVTEPEPNTAAAPAVAASEPADEIMTPDLALVDGPAAQDGEPPISIAGLPME